METGHAECHPPTVKISKFRKFKRDIKIINLQTDLATPDGPFKERKTKEKKLF